MDKGLLILNTGNGKGKTTAALGLAFRAMGHHKKVCLIQFIKGSETYGELFAVERYIDLVDVFVTGRGFSWQSDDIDKDQLLALKGWDLAREQLNSPEYFMVILDELTYLITLGFLKADDILNHLKHRREDLHVVVTGRYAPAKLIEAADLVTEMQEIKHPYTMGVMAQQGIEF
ncbi:Cob(I)yrinic acid a,c-diamide adenosyltransferase [Desulfamplus magnetovallimortis]|uniref:corrinoid adenosyltransferase n=1 Tax=Desulfamplus magnetovallimortis TaxID=1246637 RepID=A0A1W1HHQ4_9BACT|nr:cob(I)yrinic acid a,c-diamide adenosyltransferase [Desulfamplus magnetovallimortis]SLM31908.1 Cob(I)yrinic acid a,c-diamide adenosyltransferase [Desulfamplus magnetovallimortis]